MDYYFCLPFLGTQKPKANPHETHFICAFGRRELATLEKIYEDMCSTSSQTKAIQKSAFLAKFSQNRDFGAKLFQWITTHHAKYRENPEFHCFVRIVECLTKEPEEYQLAKDFVHMERIELFALISLEKFDVTRDEASKLKISYTDSIKIDLLKIFRTDGDSSQDDLGFELLLIKSLNKQELIDYEFYVYQLKDRMRFINKALTNYFCSKFIDSTYTRYLNLPKLDSGSTIFSKQLLVLFWLNNPQIQKVETLNLLYSMSKKGSSLTRLAASIGGYSGPVLILLRHTDHRSLNNTSDSDSSTCVFGAYSNNTWREELSYQGNHDSFVFSLLPKYKQFQAYKGEGGKNYSYLNTRKIANSRFKPGLGFGGNDFKNFRLWIDEDMESNSYVLPDDSTYEKGFLIRPDISKLNITQIEIWGLGGAEALREQERFHAAEAAQIEKARKVRREDFLNNQFDREILFEKTFAVANNKRDDA